MFANLSEIGRGSRVYDVCIIGTGPAGMTLALELGGRGMQVALLEAGGEYYTTESQDFYAGTMFGPLKFPLDICRLRFLGGTSNHWGGWCRPLERWDFKRKIADVPTEWPIGRDDLDPYLKRAANILELSNLPDDIPLDDNVTITPFVYSPPVHFSTKYKEELRRSRNITVALNACVTNLTERGGQIVSAEVASPDGRRYPIAARRYVLCAGGIENSRLLLWFNELNQHRIVKNPKALGRYWMEHPHFSIGEAILGESLPSHFDQKDFIYVAPTPKAIAENKILNCGLRLWKMEYEGSKKLIGELACVAPKLGRWAMARLHKDLICGVALRAAWEQAPRPWNRVTLSAERDALGMPRVDLHWELTDDERHTVRRTAELLGGFLAHHGNGRVRLLDWVTGAADFPSNDEIKGNHHMGGTRMHVDPSLGIVDSNCKVHGLANLYIGGSSVFPSTGHANPTWTIVQLALRLADHLGASHPAGPALRMESPAAAAGVSRPA